MLKTPLVIVNFKTYPEATGERALELAKTIEEVAVERKINAVVAPQHVDIHRISSRVRIPVIAQHIDPISPGRNTGWVSSESVKSAGAVGTLVNHSEHKLPIPQIKEIVKLAKEAGLMTVACTADVEESKKVAEVGPDMIAIEPPELIGTGIPVSRAKPEVVRNSVGAIKEINPKVRVLCGAGVTTGEDVSKALELGTEGVLIASGVVRAKDKKAAMEDIVSAMIKAK
ncbi:MAG: triose-phosphate isomerase [Hadesarchaea archaeon DG-33-1]|nr:MAG: triose-phosphate isomerase [Hadesarchaea archaeon DG-33-1]